MTTRLFDTDQHITMPPDTWVSRMPKKFQDQAPHVEDTDEGDQVWVVGQSVRYFGLENCAGTCAADYSWRTRYDLLPKATYEPAARLEVMDQDGVQAALFFSSGGSAVDSIEDDELYLTCIKVYNDAAFEWCQADPGRMLPVAVMPNRGVEEAMGELLRLSKMGYRTFAYNGSPSGEEYPIPSDDPFWATVQETGLVISMHGGSGTGKKSLINSKASTARGAEGRMVTGAKTIPGLQEGTAAGRATGLGGQVTLGHMIMTGVLERFPDLKLSLVETNAGWLPSFCERMDALFQSRRWSEGFQLKQLPSTYVDKIKISFDREFQAAKFRHLIGVDKLTWGSDYPHIGNFWPHSRFYTDLLLHGLTDEEKAQILWSNAADFYGVN